MTLKAAELFAGYGGLALAVEEVFGAETAWFSEFEDAPSRILKHHWPEVPNYGDVTKIDFTKVPHVDIISGGSPCQDLSAAGRRKGMTDGTRSNLWVQMREATATIKPTYVVWENVRGAYSAEAYSDLEHCPGCMGNPADRGAVLRALGRVLGDLSDLGYDCQWRGLRAADVGAPHGRFRVFLLATKNTDLTARSERRLTASGQEEAGRARSNPGGRSGAPTADTDGGERDGRERDQVGGAQPRIAVARGGDVTPAYPSRDESKRWGITGELGSASGTSESNGEKREWVREATSDSGAGDPHTATDASDAERRGAESDYLGTGSEGATEPRERTGEDVAWGPYEPAIRRWESALGRRAPAPTEPTGRDGNHRLSARFAEWMMGVPDGWIVDVPGVSRNEALKAAGNGVVPQQAAAALRDMLNHTQTERRIPGD